MATLECDTDVATRMAFTRLFTTQVLGFRARRNRPRTGSNTDRGFVLSQNQAKPHKFTAKRGRIAK